MVLAMGILLLHHNDHALSSHIQSLAEKKEIKFRLSSFGSTLLAWLWNALVILFNRERGAHGSIQGRLDQAA